MRPYIKFFLEVFRGTLEFSVAVTQPFGVVSDEYYAWVDGVRFGVLDPPLQVVYGMGHLGHAVHANHQISPPVVAWGDAPVALVTPRVPDFKLKWGVTKQEKKREMNEYE